MGGAVAGVDGIVCSSWIVVVVVVALIAVVVIYRAGLVVFVARRSL